MTAPRTSHEIRESFLSFFEQRAHRRVKSSSLVPHADPTLLFTNAGMNQFKDIFTGREKRDYSRATSSQKCVRAGGKHNDLENVGFTARHHTFFEMLGNFSFGDYFKRDAIGWGWEWVTKVLGIPAARLTATVFRDDDEAAALWEEIAGLPPDRIVRLGEKDNFWAMGETGPCGPCSEIHFHVSDDIPCAEEKAGRACQGVACDCDRWLEIWNLVFMQFEKNPDRTMTPLPRPSIDTGAGLERVTAVVQGVRSNYDTDLLRGIIRRAEELSNKKYTSGGPEVLDDVSMRVIADHARATTFLVADGVMPSNEGRGYVLRRIMRRAIRHGKRIGLEKVFLPEVCERVISMMGEVFPELAEHRALVVEVARNEEEAFRRTLTRGLQILDDDMHEARASGETTLPGDAVFMLYDTYGFPPDLTRIIAGEHGFQVDEEGFEKLMEEQRRRGAFGGSGEQAISDVYRRVQDDVGQTVFTGYEEVLSHGTVRAIVEGAATVHSAPAGARCEVVTDRTPFYGEQGGQIGDTGAIVWPSGRAEVLDTQRPLSTLYVHKVRVLEGTLKVGDKVELAIDATRRAGIRRNHSATHLLHRALREVLGEHVKQAGSIVAPDYLRFDYAHFAAPTDEQIAEAERRVNRWVTENPASVVEVLPFDEAKKSGAIALFGEKYGDRVRVMKIGPSVELCGGTHVARSGDIGFFKVTQESAIAAGVRRIVAITGPEAVAWAQEQERSVLKAAAALKSAPRDLPVRAEAAASRIKELERELESVRQKMASLRSGDLLAAVREVNGIKILATRVDSGDPKSMRELADKLRDKLGSGVVALAGEQDGKAQVLVAVTQDLTGRLRAGDIIKAVAGEIGGRGGGKPDLAQAGGPDVAGIDRALARVAELVSKAPQANPAQTGAA